MTHREATVIRLKIMLIARGFVPELGAWEAAISDDGPLIDLEGTFRFMMHLQETMEARGGTPILQRDPDFWRGLVNVA